MRLCFPLPCRSCQASGKKVWRVHNLGQDSGSEVRETGERGLLPYSASTVLPLVVHSRARNPVALNARSRTAHRPWRPTSSTVRRRPPSSCAVCNQCTSLYPLPLPWAEASKTTQKLPRGTTHETTSLHPPWEQPLCATASAAANFLATQKTKSRKASRRCGTSSGTRKTNVDDCASVPAVGISLPCRSARPLALGLLRAHARICQSQTHSFTCKQLLLGQREMSKAYSTPSPEKKEKKKREKGTKGPGARTNEISFYYSIDNKTTSSSASSPP